MSVCVCVCVCDDDDGDDDDGVTNSKLDDILPVKGLSD